MSQIMCLFKKLPEETECLCYDDRPCNIYIDDGGKLICRYGDAEGVVEGLAKVICPLEIETERKKWEAFIKQEMELNLLTGQ